MLLSDWKRQVQLAIALMHMSLVVAQSGVEEFDREHGCDVISASSTVWDILEKPAALSFCSHVQPTIGATFCNTALCMILILARRTSLDGSLALSSPAAHISHDDFGARSIANELMFAKCAEFGSNGNETVTTACVQIGASTFDSRNINTQWMGLELLTRLIQEPALTDSFESGRKDTGKKLEHAAHASSGQAVAMRQIFMRLNSSKPGTRWMAAKGLQRFAASFVPQEGDTMASSGLSFPHIVASLVSTMQDDDSGATAVGLAAMEALTAVSRAAAKETADVHRVLQELAVHLAAAKSGESNQENDGSATIAQLLILGTIKGLGSGTTKAAATPSSVINALENLASSPDAPPHVRAHSLLAVGSLGSVSSVPTLKVASKAEGGEEMAIVRCAAHKALTTILQEPSQEEAAETPLDLEGECEVFPDSEFADYESERMGESKEDVLERLYRRPNDALERLLTSPPSTDATQVCVLYLRALREPPTDMFGRADQRVNNLAQRLRWRALLTLPWVAQTPKDIRIVQDAAFDMLRSVWVKDDNRGADRTERHSIHREMDHILALKAIELMGLYAELEVIPVLGEALARPDDLVKFTAAELLVQAACRGRQAKTVAVQSALSQLTVSEAQTRAAAGTALRRIANQCYSPHVGQAVGSALLGRLYAEQNEVVTLKSTLRRLLLEGGRSSDSKPTITTTVDTAGGVASA